MMDPVTAAAYGTLAVTVIGAVGTQLRSTIKLTRSLGSPGDLGTVHDTLKAIDGRLTKMCERLEAVEAKVHV